MTIFEKNRELLDQFRQGQREALSTVYFASVDKVSLVVRNGFLISSKTGVRVPGVMGSETERDIVQEVFAKAFSQKARLGYDGLRPYSPYLIQITRNLLIDYWRKQGREYPVDFEDDLSRSEDNAFDDGSRTKAESPEEALHWKKLREETNNYVGGLSPTLQEFVKLRFEDELSQYELVEKLGITRWKIRRLEAKVQSGLTRYLKKRGLWEK